MMKHDPDTSVQVAKWGRTLEFDKAGGNLVLVLEQ